MRQYKEQCEALVKAGAIILVRDGFTEKGVPVYVTRKVTGCYGIKHGRNSIWGVCVNQPFADGADGVSYELILGINIDGKVVLMRLYYDVEVYSRLLTTEQKLMVLSDAETRLKMADRQPRAHKIEEFFRNLNSRAFPAENVNNDHLASYQRSKKKHQTSGESKMQGRQYHSNSRPNLQIFALYVVRGDQQKKYKYP